MGIIGIYITESYPVKNGYEERRLRWSIEKVKRNWMLSRAKSKRSEQIIKRLLTVCKPLQCQFEKNVQVNQNSNEQQLKKLSEFSQDTVLAIKLSHDEQAKLLNAVQQNQFEHLKVIKNQALSFEKILASLSEK